MSDSVLQTDALRFRYGASVITDNVSLRVEHGARHALIGPNGAGKTTLIHLLTGVLAPSSGQIRLLGREITRLSVHQRVRRGLIRTFQINQLFRTMTPRQSLALTMAVQRGRANDGWRPPGFDRSLAHQCETLIARFHLGDVADRTVDELPYGKQRLLEIAIAFACEPRVLLLDEPAAGVPGGERREILDTIGALPQDVSVLLIEHDMDLVFAFARRMTVLVGGAILTEGSPDEIAADPRVREIYLGSGLHGRT